MIITIPKLLASFGVLTFAQVIIAKWLEVRLSNSIKHEYDKKLEDYRVARLRQQKAEAVAELFAYWVKYRGQEEKFLDKKELVDYYEKLNKLSLEITLWIEDEKLLEEIMRCLQLAPDAPDIRTLTGKIRKILLEKSVDNFPTGSITLWPTDNKWKKLFG